MPSYKPSTVRVYDVFIESHNGKILNITDLFSSITISESLWNPTLIGAIELIDAAGLLAELPVIGQEKVYFQIERADAVYQYEFRTTHVEKVLHNNAFTLQYVINLVEEAFYNNSIQLVSQSFTGPISKTVEIIHNDFLEKDIDVEASSGNYNLVVPNWSPYSVIRWCMRRARNENNSPMMLFSSLYNGTQMKSIETLFEQDPFAEYYRSKKNEADVNPQKMQQGDFPDFDAFMNSASEFYELEVGPTLETLHKGAYGSKTLLVDTSRKSYNLFDFKYKDQQDKIVKLSKETVMPDSFSILGQSANDFTTTKQMNFAHSSGSFDDGSLSYNSDVLNTEPFFNSYLHTLNNYRYRLKVNGRFGLGVGQCVDLNITKNILKTAENSNMSDERRSGKHIITNLKHIIVRSGDNYDYAMVFDAARDSMEKPIDAE